MAALRIALITIRLVTRTKVALFFTFVFPLGWLFVYAGIFAHGNPNVVAYLFGPVLTLNIMGSGFWGLGLQSVTQRERGSLRRYRLAPVGPGSIVIANLLANYLLQLPTIAIMVLCAMLFFHMPLKITLLDLFILVTIGNFAFAGFGLTIASLANTMQEAQVYNNIVWLSLLFLSGTTIPLPDLPRWIQRVSTFLPATYLVSAFQGIISLGRPLSTYGPELASLVVSGTFALLFAWKLFRWEKEERIPNSRKLMSLLFVLPFLLMGVWMNARANPTKSWAQAYNMIEKPSENKSDKRADRAQTPAPAGSESGLVSDFEEEAPTSKFGAGWSVSTDSILGGQSQAEFRVTLGGAQGSKGSLLIAGQIASGNPASWAGAMFFPGARAFAPANLSSKKEISFWAKGDGKTYRVMLFAQSLGYMPATRTFVAGPQWREFSFPLAAFQNMDGHDLTGVLFCAGPEPGTFAFQIDEVRFK